MFLDYFALGILIFVALVLFYGIIAIHFPRGSTRWSVHRRRPLPRSETAPWIYY